MQKKEQEQYGALAECSFAPVTGRGPKSGSRAVAAKLPAPTRLYANHSSKYKQVRRYCTYESDQRCQRKFYRTRGDADMSQMPSLIRAHTPTTASSTSRSGLTAFIA